MAEQDKSGNAPAPQAGARSGADAKDQKSKSRRVFRAAMRIKTASRTKSANEEPDVKYFEPAGVGGRKKGDVVQGLDTEEMKRLWRSGALVEDHTPDEDSDTDEPNFDDSKSSEDTGADGRTSATPTPKSQGPATPDK